MQVLSITELMRLTRTELCALVARITSDLPGCPEGSIERATALINLANIRRVLARRPPRARVARCRPCRPVAGRGERCGAG